MDRDSFGDSQHMEKLLESDASSSEEEDIDIYLKGREQRSRQTFRYKCTITIFLALLGITNLCWWSIYRQTGLTKPHEKHLPGQPELTYCKRQALKESKEKGIH